MVKCNINRLKHFYSRVILESVPRSDKKKVSGDARMRVKGWCSGQLHIEVTSLLHGRNLPQCDRLYNIAEISVIPVSCAIVFPQLFATSQRRKTSGCSGFCVGVMEALVDAEQALGIFDGDKPQGGAICSFAKDTIKEEAQEEVTWINSGLTFIFINVDSCDALSWFFKKSLRVHFLMSNFKYFSSCIFKLFQHLRAVVNRFGE